MYYKFLAGDKSPVSTVLGSLGFKDNSFTYKINEINICTDFNESELHGNGFYFADEKNILNFLGYGTTLYEVEIPPDATIIEINDVCKEYKSNKIILKNPIEITNDLVKKMLADGATISPDKFLGVLTDLDKLGLDDIYDTIFNLIDENDAQMAYNIIQRLDFTKNHYNAYINKYENTTNPEVISIIHNSYNYNKYYANVENIADKILLGKIQKNTGRKIHEILDEFEKQCEIHNSEIEK